MEHHFPWDEMTLRGLGGYLEVLKWAREHDCPWDERSNVKRRSGPAPGLHIVWDERSNVNTPLRTGTYM